MSFLQPIRIAPTEAALATAIDWSRRMEIVADTCADQPAGIQKRLIQSLYESGVIHADEAVHLIARLGLKEA